MKEHKREGHGLHILLLSPHHICLHFLKLAGALKREIISTLHSNYYNQRYPILSKRHMLHEDAMYILLLLMHSLQVKTNQKPTRLSNFETNWCMHTNIHIHPILSQRHMLTCGCYLYATPANALSTQVRLIKSPRHCPTPRLIDIWYILMHSLYNETN